MRFQKKFLVLFSFILLVSCSGANLKDEKLEPVVTPQPTPPKTEFNGIETIDTASGIQIKIANSSFDKPYIIQNNIAFQKDFGPNPSNPTSWSLKSRVVTFKKEGDKILLMEYSKPFKPDESYPADILLTTFPITEEQADGLVFDFNAGMKDLLYADEWYGSDFGGEVVMPDIIVEITNSYLSEPKKHENAISFAQIMTLKNNDILLPAKIVYYLKDYVPNLNFTQKMSPGFKYLGYFESGSIVRNDFGTAYSNITKFDISKPIKFYISSNTPKEYQDAMLKGILYWNKAFGKDVITAEVAPEGVFAPSFEHNIVQWHEHHNADYAYAQAQLDPLTGELLHAQVFIPSTFSEWAKAYSIPKEMRKDLDFEKIINSEKENKEVFPFPKTSRNMPFDIVNLENYFKDAYKHKDIFSSISTERTLEVTNYILTALVAHEVGHAIGLRHNFAGSLVGELKGEDLKNQTLNFIKTNTIPDNFKPGSNSIMEYIPMYDEIMIGALIQNPESDALPYDKYAINWGYFSDTVKPEFEGHVFCTDSGVRKYSDCDVFDSGRDVVERTSFNTIENFVNIPRLLAEFYLNAKTYIDKDERVPIYEATPSSWQLLSKTAQSFDTLTSILSNKLTLVNILINYPDLSDIDSDMISEETDIWLDEQIDYANSVNDILKIINPKFFRLTAKGFSTNFESIINSKDYSSVELYEGGQTGFTTDEIKYMLNRSKDLFPKVEENLAYVLTFSLAQTYFKPVKNIENIEKKVSEWSAFVLTDLNKSEFSFSLNTRRQALELLLSKGPYPDWMQKYIPEIAKRVLASIEAVLGMPIAEIKPEDYPREEQQRIIDELEIYYSLSRFIIPEKEPTEDSI